MRPDSTLGYILISFPRGIIQPTINMLRHNLVELTRYDLNNLQHVT